MDTDTLHKQQTEEHTGHTDEQSASAIRERAHTVTRSARALAVAASIPLVAGLLGSLAAILVMGVLRLTVGAPTLPELLGERLLLTLSAGEFVSLLVRFAPNSKTEPLGLTLLGQFLFGILLGPIYHLLAGRPSGGRAFWPGRRAWITATTLVLAMEGVGLALFWPVLDAGLVGDTPERARLLTSLTMLATFVAFVGVTMLANHWLHRAWLPHSTALAEVQAAPGANRPSPRRRTGWPQARRRDFSRQPISRRVALGAAGAVVLAVATGGVGIDRLIASYFARSNLSYEGMETGNLSPITPIKDFYVVSKNVLDPQVDLGPWQLEVKGLVNQPKIWNYAQLRELPSETRAVTLECIANNVGGHLLSTAEWTGVLLKTILAEAGGAQSAGKYMIFTSVDGYQYSQSLANLLEARALLEWEMNGEMLPERHGYPLRAVVPGRYGEQSAKWLTSIEVVDQPYNGGLYQSQGWSSAQLETMSRINGPLGTAPLGTITVVGVAFAGIRGIQQVEVSADNGLTWHAAALMLPLSDQTWVFWSWTWQPAARGTYTLVVRAIDGTGTTQTETRRGTVPSGATGWHHVTVQVV